MKVEKLSTEFQDWSSKLLTKKAQLETLLLPHLSKFMEETGVPISYIRVETIEKTIIGDPIRSYIIGSISIETNESCLVFPLEWR